MRLVSLVFVLTLTIMMFHPIKAEAFECPNHFKRTRTGIVKAEKALKKMARIHRVRRMMTSKEMADTKKMIIDAKTLLAEAIQHHETAQTLTDHGLAIAKADAALKYAEAADLLHVKYMGMSKMKMKSN